MVAKPKNIEDQHKVNLICILPLIFIAMIGPLIVRLKVIKLPDMVSKFWVSSVDLDSFSYYKMIALVICAILSLFALGLNRKIVFYKLKVNKVYAFSAIVYLLFVTASTVFSDYRSVSILGFPDRFEGLLALYSYIIIFFAAICLVNNERYIRILTAAMLIGSAIIGIIGLTQILGHDFLKSDFGKYITIPSGLRNKINLNNVHNGNIVYSTLFHYNYVGSYMAMIVPFTMTMFLFTKNLKYKILLGLSLILSIIALFGSTSRAGMVSVLVPIIIIGIFYFREKKIISGIKGFTLITISIIILGLFINYMSGDYLGKRFDSLYKDVKNVFNTTETQSTQTALKDIHITGSKATIETPEETIHITMERSGKVLFSNIDNEPIQTMQNEQEIIPLDKEYQSYRAIINKTNGFNILNIKKQGTPIDINFRLKNNEIVVANRFGEELDIHNIKSWGFQGLEHIGSARGYIWSRSLPMLSDRMIIGSGPDTFAMEFPQFDILGKLKAYGSMWILVDKPHNLYLQIAINTGVLSLIAILVLFINYLLESLKVLWKYKISNTKGVLRLSIFVGVIGYLSAAFFNDSVVSVAPIYWLLLGIGVGLNTSLKLEPQQS